MKKLIQDIIEGRPADDLEAAAYYDSAMKRLYDAVEHRKPEPARERGDCAKLREALASQSVNDADAAAWILDKNPEDVCEERMPWSELCDMAYNLAAGFTTLHNAVKDALSAPPRNCNRFETAEEADAAYRKFCEREIAKIPMDAVDYSRERAKIPTKDKWLFAPATEKEGGVK